MSEQETAQEEFNRKTLETLTALTIIVGGLLPENKVKDFNAERIEPITAALGEMEFLLTLIKMQRDR